MSDLRLDYNGLFKYNYFKLVMYLNNPVLKGGNMNRINRYAGLYCDSLKMMEIPQKA